MRCPACNSENAFAGIFGGISCVNPSCTHGSGKARIGTSTNTPVIDTQKEVARDVIKQFENVGCIAICAGGAPRNWLLGVKANDLDIYVSRGWFSDQDKENTIKLGMQEVGKTYVGTKRLFAQAVHQFAYRGETIQVITAKETKSFYSDIGMFADHVWRTFDFCVCKIGMLADGKVITDPSFDDDIKRKRLTLDLTNVDKYNVLSKLPERYRKMQKLFPGFEGIIK